MLTPLIQRPRSLRLERGRERGVTMVLVAMAMVGIIAMAALSIDVITLYLAKEEAQRAADAAALAGARIIALSGLTGDPSNASSSWQAICGGSSSPASLTASAVAAQNVVGGTAADTITVTYSTAGGGSGTDCSSLAWAGPAGINPMITVQVTRSALPAFFSRIWGKASSSVSASATAEVFNSSPLAPTAATIITPVQPRCVKPMMIPNLDPRPTGTCGTPSNPACPQFVDTTNATIVNSGVVNGGTGVIGETFTLFANCAANGSASCSPITPLTTTPVPSVNVGESTAVTAETPNLEYLPGQVLGASVAVPSGATAGSGGVPDYIRAIAGCDQSTDQTTAPSTIYHCGISSADLATPNAVDLKENPAGSSGGDGDTAIGLAALATGQTDVPLSGQDTLDTTAYPFEITTGKSNPRGIPARSQVTASNQIVTLPIYDSGQAFDVNGAGVSPVTIVGFLQVFVDDIDANGNIKVTVLNVVGCGTGTTSPNRTLDGSSPVPVRLVTPP